MATIEETAGRVYRAALKKTPHTAGELAERAGFPSGRAISTAIGALKRDGKLVQATKRPARYTKG